MTMLLLVLIVGAQAAGPAAIGTPRAVDDRLTIELFTSEPELVTPTGIAVDSRGRVLVIESHTHFRPEGYDGPETDRIRLFEDTNKDGKADRIRTFFEGSVHTMNLAVYRDDSVFVATRSQIFRLHDRDGDSAADDKEVLVELDTPGNYPHNGLSGFAFDFAGNVYFGFGENLGAEYHLRGSDGTTLSGGGEGGNVYRCRPDGSKLELVATGFWNPFHLAFDAYEHLFAVDNDPDSRPPCRLLHVVDGGDFGYRFRNGRKGVHPFTAWNGELPGTLPMVAGTGEAPSGIVIYQSDMLPGDYRGTALATSWGDHRIEKFVLSRQGASFRSHAVPVLQGDENFRPVGIAVAPDGSLYVSDWVDKSYPLHKKGRIWRIAAANAPSQKRDSATLASIEHPDRTVREQVIRKLVSDPAAVHDLKNKHFDDPEIRALVLLALLAESKVDAEYARKVLWDPSAEVRELAVRKLPDEFVTPARIATEDESAAVQAAALRRIRQPRELPVLCQALESEDPFVRLAARGGLVNSVETNDLLSLAQASSAEQRLGAALLLRSEDSPRARAALPRLLKDNEPQVRQVAVQWVAESGLSEYRQDLMQGLAAGATSRELFESYLAALERLDGKVRTGKDEIAGQAYVAKLAFDTAMTVEVRQRALRVLRPDDPTVSVDQLKKLLGTPAPGLQIEALRTLRERADSSRIPILLSIADNRNLPPMLRAEAIVGLNGSDAGLRSHLLRCALESSFPEVQAEALRSLRAADLTGSERDVVTSLAEMDPRLQPLVQMTIDGHSGEKLPDSQQVDAWSKLLEGPADMRAGERVFYHPQGPGCYRCHQMNGRGGMAGPELSATANKLSRERLIESILLPSKEIAPQFTPWALELADGQVKTGILIRESDTGVQTYADSQGNFFEVSVADIANRQPLSQSVMPDKLHESMTLQEFRDLLAYLRSP